MTHPDSRPTSRAASLGRRVWQRRISIWTGVILISIVLEIVLKQVCSDTTFTLIDSLMGLAIGFGLILTYAKSQRMAGQKWQASIQEQPAAGEPSLYYGLTPDGKYLTFWHVRQPTQADPNPPPESLFNVALPTAVSGATRLTWWQKVVQAGMILWACLCVVGLIGTLYVVWQWWGPVFDQYYLSGVAGGLVAVFGFGFVLLLLGLSPYLILIQGVWRSLRRLDYATAAKRAERIQRWLNSWTLKSFVLLHAGRYDEAEKAVGWTFVTISASLATWDKFTATWPFVLLGRVLIAQERYENGDDVLIFAINSGYKGGIQIRRNERIVVSSEVTVGKDDLIVLAESYLLQGIKPQEALELATLGAQGRWRWLEFEKWYTPPEVLATQAWALASNGQHKEAETVLARALDQLDRRLPLVQASVHYRAGQGLRLCGDTMAARGHFEEAIKLDAAGHYGQLARAARAQL